jgi:hypothetical protein
MGHHLVCFCCIYDGGSSSFPSTNSGNLLTRKLWGKLDDNLKHHLNILRHRICRWIYVHISNILYSVVISTLFGKSYMSSIMFYPFIWSISLPSSVFLNIWYLGLLWSLFICLFGLRFPAFAWTPKTYSLQIVACNSLGSHAFAAAIPPLAIPLGESGMNYSLHTVQEECSHLVMECSGLFNAQGLKSWKP